jgi:hypothetical protein
MPRKWAVAVPILGMLLSDMVIGAYKLPVMLTVYACFALTALLGAWVKEMRPAKLMATALASSTIFFLATNFAVWAAGDWYEKSWQGLALCYTLAVPFFRATLTGDLLYTGVLFGVWLYLSQTVNSLKSKTKHFFQIV